jgi:hypothetical protein
MYRVPGSFYVTSKGCTVPRVPTEDASGPTHPSWPKTSVVHHKRGHLAPQGLHPLQVGPARGRPNGNGRPRERAPAVDVVNQGGRPCGGCGGWPSALSGYAVARRFAALRRRPRTPPATRNGRSRRAVAGRGIAETAAVLNARVTPTGLRIPSSTKIEKVSPAA